MSRLSAIFEDATGSLNASELTAVGLAIVAAGLTIYDVAWQHQHFDIQGFGIGAGALVSAVGAAQMMRGDRAIELKKMGEP